MQALNRTTLVGNSIDGDFFLCITHAVTNLARSPSCMVQWLRNEEGGKTCARSRWEAFTLCFSGLFFADLTDCLPGAICPARRLSANAIR